MNPLKAIIIDDEPEARISLAGLLKLHCEQVTVVAVTGVIADGIQHIRAFNPDIVFIDVHIGEENGFELLDQLQPLNFRLIFTTAYSEFAAKAFRYNAIDYLLKPVDPLNLIAAVEKAEASGNAQNLERQMVELVRAMKFSQPEKIVLSTLDGIHFIPVRSIIRVEGDANYSTFFMDTGEKILISRNLKFYEGLLPPKVFFRVHQSHLVNIEAIRKIKTQEGNTVELTDGVSVPLAKRRKEELLALLKLNMAAR